MLKPSRLALREARHVILVEATRVTLSITMREGVLERELNDDARSAITA